MGNYRFRLSDMMPNSWFYKLQDMRRATTTTNIPHPSYSHRHHHHHHHHHHQRKIPSVSQSSQAQPYIPNRPSYYVPSNTTSPANPKASDTPFPVDPPRKPDKTAARMMPVDHPSSNPPSSVSRPDIIIDMKDYAPRLPPIITKPVKKGEAETKKPELQHSKHAMLRKAQQGLHRIKVRPGARPRSPKVQAGRGRKPTGSNGLAESFVVVKRSADPRGDFKESMVEMIVENELRGSKDLEELLACFLSLNSDEYHGLIVEVFEEIWIDLAELRA